jgi:hypothetical protein
VSAFGDGPDELLNLSLVQHVNGWKRLDRRGAASAACERTRECPPRRGTGLIRDPTLLIGGRNPIARRMPAVRTAPAHQTAEVLVLVALWLLPEMTRAGLMAQRRGRPVEIRDCQIAGIAIARRATLATCNVRHFERLRVTVVDPWVKG